MCLATPMRVISIDGSWANVTASGHNHRVNIDLIPNVKVGDYVIAHADLAIGVVEPEEAVEIEKVSSQLNH